MVNPSSYLKILKKSQFKNPNFCSQISHITSKNPSTHNPAIRFLPNQTQHFHSSNAQFDSPAQQQEEPFHHKQQHGTFPNIQISHPWREWVDLMQKLLKNGYFDEIGNPFSNNGDLGNKDANLIRTASLNFARDQFQLIRYLSRNDLVVIAGSGCPSTDRKVVNSGKRLRAHVGIDEGNVCSTCILRGDCDRAYVKAREEEGGRTVDVMRLLLTYGLDPVIGSVANKPCLNKRVKESVRTLLKEMVCIRVDGYDSEPSKSTTHEIDTDRERSKIDVPLKKGEWICPKCDFLNFARNVKCLRCDYLFEERVKKIAEDQEHLPLKKGDWICEKCNFLNFARNTRCLLCKEKPPRRQLHPGEWECDSCNYINFKRNMICLKCDHKRPIASASAADIGPQPVNNNVKNHHQSQPWFVDEKQSRFDGDNSLKFVESEGRDHINSSSWNKVSGFMDFPVAGGKSDLSRNAQKQELWKNEMADHSGCAKEDTHGYNSSIVTGTSEYHASGDDDDDDDDDMAEWFEGGKRP